MIQSNLIGNYEQFIRERARRSEPCRIQRKYGAGDGKIGKIVHGTNKDGKQLRAKFLKAIPAIAELKQAIENTLVAEKGFKGNVIKWKRKYLRGLDGRPLRVRSLHSALNTLLQAAGASICKQWILTLEERLLAIGLDHGADFKYMAWVHKPHCAH